MTAQAIALIWVFEIMSRSPSNELLNVCRFLNVMTNAMCLTLIVSVCLRACVPVCVHVCLCAYLSVSVCLHVCLSMCLYVCLSVCLLVYVSLCVFLFVYVSLSACLSMRVGVMEPVRGSRGKIPAPHLKPKRNLTAFSPSRKNIQISPERKVDYGLMSGLCVVCRRSLAGGAARGTERS